MCACSDLIGLRYRLGADGSNGEIDCIHLVYRVLEDLKIPTPTFNPSWYQASRLSIGRVLMSWGDRIDHPLYDGDVLLMRQTRPAFAVTWQTGILYINQDLERVAWCPLSNAMSCHCFRLKGS